MLYGMRVKNRHFTSTQSAILKDYNQHTRGLWKKSKEVLHKRNLSIV